MIMMVSSQLALTHLDESAKVLEDDEARIVFDARRRRHRLDGRNAATARGRGEVIQGVIRQGEAAAIRGDSSAALSRIAGRAIAWWSCE